MKAQELLGTGFARAPYASASPVVLSSEAAPAVVVLTPTSAPAGAPAASGVGGYAGLKALEARSALEGGVANTAYATSHALSSAYYAYASPPPDGGPVILPPPPLVYVKETITTVTTTYPAGTPVPVASATGGMTTPTATSRLDEYFK